MNHDDLFDDIDQDLWDADDLFRDIDALHTDDALLEDILREYGSDSTAEADEEPYPDAAELDTYEDSGTFRSYDGSREYRSFDQTLPDASPEEWYRYGAEEEDGYDIEDEEYYDDYDGEEEDLPARRHPVLSGIAHALLIILTALSLVYLVVIYSGIPAVTHLRTMYIQTAMSTINHKWLATALVPGDLIADVMRAQYEADDAMMGIESRDDWGVDIVELPEFAEDVDDSPGIPSEAQTANYSSSMETISPEEETFFEIFWELDRDSVKRYMTAHPEALAGGWAGVDINESGLSDSGTEMTTIYGDQVLAVNAVDGITLIRVYLSSNRSRGVLAICKDTSRLSLCAATTLPSVGQTAGKICDDNGGVLAITGSAFMDDGTANGGQISGLAVCSGRTLGERLGGAGDKRLELRSDDRMYIVDSSSALGEGTRDACEFHPGLIIDGKVYYDDFWSSPNPRAVLGQSSRLETMMVVLEGRLASSLGCGVDYVSDKMAEYGCVQALNLDGGTSAMMYYKGEYINLCSNTALPGGRTLPTAWVYKPAS